jgi:hypothetical protein
MTGASATGARRAEFRRIDWHRAAELLAEGRTIAAAADQIGCSRSQLSRRRNHDPVFQLWIENARARNNPHLTALRKALHDAFEKQLGKGEPRIVLWLAERLKFVSAPDERTPAQEFQALLGNLSTEELRDFEQLRDPEST